MKFIVKNEIYCKKMIKMENDIKVKKGNDYR